MRIKTHISCTQKSGGKCKGCRKKENTENEENGSLLDKFLYGGLEIPDNIYEFWRMGKNRRPFILLITGAPGTGKTTFISELAYRWAIYGYEHENTRTPLSTFYFSTESPGNMLRNHVVDDFRWDINRFPPVTDEMHVLLLNPDENNEPLNNNNQTVAPNEGYVALYGTDLQDDIETSTFEKIFAGLNKCWKGWYGTNQQHGRNTDSNLPSQPALFVVDSLNTLENTKLKANAFERLIHDFESHPLVFAFVFDSASKDEGQSLEHIADMTLRFERTDLLDSPNNQTTYNIGTFQITKARWQKHVHGRHQIKISSEDEQQEDGLQEGGLQEGGLLIYPSLHYLLSTKGQKSNNKKGNQAQSGGIQLDAEKNKPKCISTSVDLLDNLLCGDSDDRRWAGFPIGGCTAMVGVRGTKKSHLAYKWLLNNKNSDKKVLLISLQDDESGALSRLAEIAVYEGFFPDIGILKSNTEKERELLVAKMKKNIEGDTIPILYYKPSYITPDKFLFRLCKYLDKYTPDYVVINAFEQMETLFPLCATQPIFVSSIIGILHDRKITSVATGVLPGDLSGSDIGHGLLPNSDLVLRFAQNEELPISSVDPFYEDRLFERLSIDKTDSPSTINATIVDVNRVPSCKACSLKGMIYLDKDNKLDFIPLKKY